MKIFVTMILASLCIGHTASATTWNKFLSCSNAESTFVADRDSANPERVQFVIEGKDTVNYIALRIQGNSIQMPYNLHIYDGGNKLVISDLEASRSLDIGQTDPYAISIVRKDDNRAVMSWRSGSEIEPIGRYWFYNCHSY